MARYWVGDAVREHRAPGADRADAESSPGPAAHRRERMTDAVRRTLAGNVTSDDPAD